MIRGLAATICLVLGTAGFTSQAAAGAPDAGLPVHTLTVSGPGVTMYPAFSPTIDRYGVRTSDTTGGQLTVTPTTSDAGGTITVNGRPAHSGTPFPITSLSAGDEISVAFADAGGVKVDGLIYLPASFPLMTATSHGAGPSAGDVALTLGSFAHPGGLETVVDSNGVPSYVSTIAGSQDLKPAADGSGNYTVARIIGPGNFRIAVLDRQFNELTSYQTVGLGNTDSHDSILLSDGSRYFVAYVPNPITGNTDAVIQQVARNGSTVEFQWNSKDHVDPADGLVPRSAKDYAHINSIDIMANGDVLASFRNLSQVMEIARNAHDGFAVGDVVWRLGGKTNQFTFPGDPDGGPCAQHSAREMANGDILIFDDGSIDDPTAPQPLGSETADMCPDPQNPTGPRIARAQSRVVEYTLDTQARTASLTWSYQKPGQYTAFAGSTQRLADGNTLNGWANSAPGVNEVNQAGDDLWDLDMADYFSYRAWKVPARDAIDPAITIDASTAGATVPFGSTRPANFGCSDRGGSTLQRCSAAETAGGPSVASGQPLDTSSVGQHTLTVTATDGAGNVATAMTTYTVAVAPPTAPRSTHASAGHHAVTVSWTAPASNGGVPLTGYRVQRKTAGGAWATVKTTTARTYTNTGLDAGTRYYFRIAALQATIASAYSGTANAVPYTTPSAPRAERAAAGRKSVTVTWVWPNSTGGSPVTGYQVQYAPCRIGSANCTARTRIVRTRSLVLSSLSTAHRYYARVLAMNRAGHGPYTGQVSARPLG